MTIRILCAIAATFFIAACSAPVPRDAGKGHLTTESARPVPSGDIPAPVQQTINLPKPRNAPKAETYSVVVNNVAVRDLLFALARDAKINVDIHRDITGYVTLNAIDQTLPQLLSRIAKQIDMRFELDGPNLAVMPDSPYLKHYKVDYVNVARNVTGTVSTNTQIATGVPGAGGQAASGSTGGNTSSTRIENTTKNQFWESLEKNIKDILRETDKEKVISRRSSQQQEQQVAASNANVASRGEGQAAAAGNRDSIAGAGRGNQNVQAQSGNQQSSQSERDFKDYQTEFAANVIINAESGTVTVRATGRQHEKIQEFIDRVMSSSRRQVMIEATIVEVTLGDGYQQGVDWSRLRTDGSGFSVKQASVGTNIGTSVTPFVLSVINKSNPLNLLATVSLLESFGTAKVLSSPRLSVLNNQTALLKVVENFVYFNVKADTTVTANVGTTTAVTTTPQSVSVGLVMTVTPQISDNDTVILNVRPTISSISALKEDPNPSIPAGIKNYVPQIRTREIESVMRVSNGDIAVLGGLMEDAVDYRTGRFPGLGQIPVVGELLNTRNNSARKTELVIFLRPVVIKDASLAGDFSGLRESLPGSSFFTPPPEAAPFAIPTGKQ